MNPIPYTCSYFSSTFILISSTLYHITISLSRNYCTMKVCSAIHLFSHTTVLATIVIGGAINVSLTHAVNENVKISQSQESVNKRKLNNNNNKNDEDDSLFYQYERGYLVVVNEDNSVLVGANGGDLFPASIGDGAVSACDGAATVQALDNFGRRQLAEPLPRTPTFDGSSLLQSGLVYDPTELKIRNKPDGVTEEDVWNTSWVQQHRCNAPMMMQAALGRKFAGGRQPVLPLPPGDKSYFFHGECVATSVIEDKKETSPIGPIGDTLFITTSHTCTLNLCLGGGGYDCIAIYAGGGYVFDLSPRGPDDALEIAPPFRGTIIGGTGSFEGIEGTVDVVTITGTTGPIALIDTGRRLNTGLNAQLFEGWYKAVDNKVRLAAGERCTWIEPAEYALKGFEKNARKTILDYSVSNIGLIDANECWAFKTDDQLWINFNEKMVIKMLGYNMIKVAQMDRGVTLRIEGRVATDVDRHVWVKTGGDALFRADTKCLPLQNSALSALKIMTDESTLMYFDPILAAELPLHGCFSAEIDGQTWMKFDRELVALRYDADSHLVARAWEEYKTAKTDGWWKVDDSIKVDALRRDCAQISLQAMFVSQTENKQQLDTSELKQAISFQWDSEYSIDNYGCATVQIDDHLLMTYNLDLVKLQNDGSALLYNDKTLAQRFASETFKTSNNVAVLETDGHVWLKVGGKLLPEKALGGCERLLPADVRLKKFESTEHQSLMYFDSRAVEHLDRTGCLHAEIDGTTWMKYDDQMAEISLTADLHRLHARTNLWYEEISKLPVSYKLLDSEDLFDPVQDAVAGPLIRGFISFGKTTLKINVKSNIPLPVGP